MIIAVFHHLPLEGLVIGETKGEIQGIAGQPCLDTKDSASWYDGSVVLNSRHVNTGKGSDVGMCILGS